MVHRPRTLDDLALTSDERSAIHVCSSTIRALIPVSEIILFGSKARGDSTEESDIDLLVITPREISRQRRHQVLDSIYEIQLTHDVVLSILFVSSHEWNSGLVSALPIRAEVDEQGVAA